MPPPISDWDESSSTPSRRDGPADPEAALQRAENLGQKAITIDSTNAGAHALLGSVYIRYADYDRALDEMRRAVELNNSDPDAYAGLATALLWAGDVDGAVKAFETAAQARPRLHGERSRSISESPTFSTTGAPTRSARSNATLERNKTDPYSNAILAAAYAEVGRQSRCHQASRSGAGFNALFDSADFGSLLRKPDLRDQSSPARWRRRAYSLVCYCAARSFWPVLAGLFDDSDRMLLEKAAPRVLSKKRKACHW